MTIVGEVERLGRAVERGEMTGQEGVRQLLEVAGLTPRSAAEMIRDWRTAVKQYEEMGRQLVQVTGHLAAKARGMA